MWPLIKQIFYFLLQYRRCLPLLLLCPRCLRRSWGSWRPKAAVALKPGFSVSKTSTPCWTPPCWTSTTTSALLPRSRNWISLKLFFNFKLILFNKGMDFADWRLCTTGLLQLRAAPEKPVAPTTRPRPPQLTAAELRVQLRRRRTPPAVRTWTVYICRDWCDILYQGRHLSDFISQDTDTDSWAVHIGR